MQATCEPCSTQPQCRAGGQRTRRGRGGGGGGTGRLSPQASAISRSNAATVRVAATGRVLAEDRLEGEDALDAVIDAVAVAGSPSGRIIAPSLASGGPPSTGRTAIASVSKPKGNKRPHDEEEDNNDDDDDDTEQLPKKARKE